MSRICQICKIDNLADAIYCDNCGTPLGQAPARNQPQNDLRTIIDDPGNWASAPDQAVVELKPRLVVLPSNTTISLPPGESTWTIGRQDPTRGHFPDVDLTPHGGVSGGVSRKHAKLTVRNNQCFIEDLNSANSTYLNGSKINPSDPLLLHHGDQIRLGGVIMNFYTS